MSEQFSTEPMLDMFIFESTQLLEQLEQSVWKVKRQTVILKPTLMKFLE